MNRCACCLTPFLFFPNLIQYRNGITGEVVGTSGPSPVPYRYQPRRVRRTRLQNALLAKVPSEVPIYLNKHVVGIENLEHGEVRVFFRDGTQATADLVVGGDGIRSVSVFE